MSQHMHSRVFLTDWAKKKSTQNNQLYDGIFHGSPFVFLLFSPLCFTSSHTYKDTKFPFLQQWCFTSRGYRHGGWPGPKVFSQNWNTSAKPTLFLKTVFKVMSVMLPPASLAFHSLGPQYWSVSVCVCVCVHMCVCVCPSIQGQKTRCLFCVHCQSSFIPTSSSSEKRTYSLIQMPDLRDYLVFTNKQITS